MSHFNHNQHQQRFPQGGQLPWISIAVSVLAILFTVSDKLFLLGYYDEPRLQAGQLWRLLTGHLTHTNLSHLGWDLLAFLLTAGYLERFNRTLFCYALLSGVVTVDLLLLSPWAGIQAYAGLSGVLFAPLIPALVIFAQRQKSWIGWIPLTVCLMKVIWEQFSQQALLSQSGWPPYPASHLAGIIGGVIVLLSGFRSEQSDLFRTKMTKLTGLQLRIKR